MTTDQTTEPTNDQETAQEPQETPQDVLDAPEGTEAAPEAQDDDQEPQEPTDEEPGDSKDVRDAKKYRKRAQAAEAELETVRAIVGDLKAGILNQHIETKDMNTTRTPDGNGGHTKRNGNLLKLLKAEDYNVTDLIGDDGQVDHDALAAACKHINDTYGTTFGRMFTLNPRKRDTEAKSPWTQVFDNVRR